MDTYEVWHFDGRRPEVLSGGHPDKGACRRAWRLSTHAAIVRDGAVLEPKSTCGGRQGKAIANAAAEAHRAATGQAPEMAPRGPAGGDGRRLYQSSSPAVRALDAVPVEPMPAKYVPAPVEEVPEVEPVALPEPFDEAPAPVVVVRRRAPAAPTPKEPPMSASTGACPCGAPSAPTARQGGRPSVKEFVDLCVDHRTRAAGRRARTGEAPLKARAWALATPKKPASKPSKKSTPKKPARAPKRTRAEAPVADLLATVRRQRALIDALGGLDQAEALANAAARVGGPAALCDLVDELARAVS